MQSSLKTPRRASTIAFFLLLAAYVGWMLSLPAWPSQDGPMHLYYTRVLDTLFSGSTPVYTPFLYIKHLLPPYAVYYYTLLLFSHAVPLVTADRLVICLYLVAFATGFRYAASAVGPGASRTSPLACVLLLNWSLGMGFANFCLSLSFALWAIGLWLRFTSSPQLGRRVLFLLLLVLITLSHPVPLLIVLVFAGLDLLCRYVFAASLGTRPLFLRQNLRNILTLAAGALCLLYVKAFTVAHPLQQRTAAHGSVAHQILLRAARIASAKSVGLLYGHWWQVLLYRAGLVVLLLVPAVLAAVQFRRSRRDARWTPACTCFVFLLLLVVALPLLPSDFSGAYYFSERLTILLWILALLAASAWEPASPELSSPEPGPAEPRAEIAAIVFAAALSALLLHLADTSLRPLAARDRLLSETALPEIAGHRALVLAGPFTDPAFGRIAPAWNPFLWDTVALLRRNNAILENAPWLDSPIIPLAPTPALSGAWLARMLANSSSELTPALEHSPSLQRTFLGGSDLIFFSPIQPGQIPSLKPFLAPPWTCSQLPNLTVQLCAQSRPTSR